MSAAFYYPYIHVRDEGWLKTAALYYDRLYRIVPEHDYNFQPKNTTERALHEEAKFLVEARPEREAQEVADEFYEYAKLRLKTKRKRLAVLGALNGAGLDGHDFYIHVGKVPQILQRKLREMRLVEKASARGPQWVKFDQAAAVEYMTFLANRMAENRAVPVVSDDAAYQTFVRAYRTRDSVPVGNTELKLLNFAIQVGVPANPAAIGVNKILRLREKYADERRRLHLTLREFANYIEEPRDDFERSARFEEVCAHVRNAIHELNRSWIAAGVELLTSVFTVSPPVVANSISLSAGAVATLGVAIGKAYSGRQKRYGVRKESPWSYILSLQNDVGPENFLRQLARGAVV